MDVAPTEVEYPLSFRSTSAKALGGHLQNRHSVQMIGMKRVGISNFLRFFLYHKDIKSTYLPQDGKQLFIPVDLNNLLERELFPFWRLTFKRIVDSVEQSQFDEKLKEKISKLFVQSIQSGDLFLTFDGVRESLVQLVHAGIYPTIFFIRFDRLAHAATPEFFNNLLSLYDSANQKLSYVFTSYRELSGLSPKVFTPQALASYVSDMYIKPGTKFDMEIIFTTIAQKFNLKVSPSLKDILIALSGGHAQYLQLSLIVLDELTKKTKQLSEDEIVAAIENDERIMLQSEELWESLTAEEQDIVRRVDEGKKITQTEKEAGKYVWNSGFILEERGTQHLFSPLFSNFVQLSEKKKTNGKQTVEFSKKEHLLFELLEKKAHEICERETIVEEVWPEYKEYGVSDWSVDRLVARVRQKLRKQKSPWEIITVRTRGYKLVDR